MKKIIFGALVLVVSALVNAQPKITVEGLLGKKAIVVVNGQRHILGPGDVSPEGVQMLEVGKGGASLKVGDKESFYELGRERTGYQQHAKKTVSINKKGEHYYTTGSINGLSVNFVIDTGATVIAISEDVAKRVGIPFRLEGVETRVRLASGEATAWRVFFKTVKLGEIELKNVEGAVLKGPDPNPALLGMSFLKGTRMQDRNGVLYLEAKY